MPRTSTVNRSFLEAALVGYRHRLGEITLKISELKHKLGGPATADAAAPERRRRKRRRMSAAARKRLALSAKKRWAAAKKAGKNRLG
jgi:hypothetical protein